MLYDSFVVTIEDEDSEGEQRIVSVRTLLVEFSLLYMPIDPRKSD